MKDPLPEIAMFHTLCVHDHQVALSMNSDAIHALQHVLQAEHGVPTELMRIGRCHLPTCFKVSSYIVPLRFTVEEYHNGTAPKDGLPKTFTTTICGNYAAMEAHALEIIRDRVGL